MNLYIKILTSRYYFISKTNNYKPLDAVVSFITLFHVLNIFSTINFLGFDINFFKQNKFVFYLIPLACYVISVCIHEVFIFRKKTVEERLEFIEKKSLKKYDFMHLIYELFTTIFLFYSYQIPWINYFLVFLFLVGLYLIFHALIAIKEEL